MKAASVRPIIGDIEQQHAILPPSAAAGGGSEAGSNVRDIRRQAQSSSNPGILIFLKKKHVTSDHITSCVWLQQYAGCDFPLFDNSIMDTYHEYNLMSSKPIVFIPSILLYYVFIVCRSGLMRLRLGEILIAYLTLMFCYVP